MKQNIYLAVILVVFLAIAGVIFRIWLQFSRLGTNSLLAAGDKQIVKSGQLIYQDYCASCHGKNLEGQDDWQSINKDGLFPAPPHDPDGHTWHHSDVVLFDLTKLGVAKTAGLDDYKTDMPIFDGVLDDRQIIAVLSYIKSTWPDEMRQRHDQLNERSKQ